MDTRQRIFGITRSLWLGPFASPERQAALISVGITHILNVGEAPSVLFASDGFFREIAWHPIMDLERIPNVLVVDCLRTIHRMVCQPDSRVYVHCIAGWNRSPTVVWLYLIACGFPAAHARAVIEAQAPDAVPGHRSLVDDQLVNDIQEIGRSLFQPHPRPEALAGLL